MERAKKQKNSKDGKKGHSRTPAFALAALLDARKYLAEGSSEGIAGGRPLPQGRGGTTDGASRCCGWASLGGPWEAEPLATS